MGEISISGNTFSVYSETNDPLADAKAYLLGKVGGERWIDAEKIVKQRSLISATRWVIRALAARGLDDSDIPDPADTPANQFLQEATYEAAYALVITPTALDSVDQRDNKKRVKAGSAEIEFFRPQSGAILPPTAQALLLRYINSLGVSTNIGPVASGTDGKSEFEDQDAFGREDAFP